MSCNISYKGDGTGKIPAPKRPLQIRNTGTGNVNILSTPLAVFWDYDPKKLPVNYEIMFFIGRNERMFQKSLYHWVNL